LDCPRKEIWRNNLYKNYKICRTKIYDDKWIDNVAPLFKYIHTKLIYELQDYYKFHILKEDCCEGDDNIAIAKTYIREKFPTKKIIICSNDCDLLQLIDLNCNIINLKNKCINSKSLGTTKKDLLYKCILGDTSDSIKGVFPRCGPKTTMKLINNEELLENYFKKYKDSRDQYKLNEQLINFNFIPTNLKDKILKKLNLILEK
jgi:5'-3' exonuclease